jgi:methylglutaconyl-CoA hydratase
MISVGVSLTSFPLLCTVSGVPPPEMIPSHDPAIPPLIIERTGEVVTFTLNNAEHGNHISRAMFDAMLAELRQQRVAPSARVLRVQARGKVFCTGRERKGRDVASLHAEAARIIEVKRLLRNSSLITIAEVQGDAFGFGFGLAILCDFVLVAEEARLGFPEMHAGLPPAAIMAYLGEYTLPRFAFPLVLFGDPIDPQYAKQIGLISHVYPANRLSEEAQALADRILTLDPDAARRCKDFFLTAQQNSFDQNCRLATETLTVGSLNVLAREK